jgi:hypothetical protein
MKLLAIGRPAFAGDVRAEIQRHAHEELSVLWRGYAAGEVREMYSPGGPGVVLVFETSDRATAQATLEELPLVRRSVIEFELIELHPFSALEMLFQEPSR